MMNSRNNQQEVFNYHDGQKRSDVPRYITLLRCDSSVATIPDRLCFECQFLVTVELNEDQLSSLIAFTFNV